MNLDVVFFIALLTLIYLLIGLLILDSCFGVRLYRADVNPLWRIPGLIFWPMLIAFEFGEDLAWVIINYIRDVRYWYDKRKGKGKSVDVKKDCSITINITNERVAEKVKEELEKRGYVVIDEESESKEE